ncbi:hypothetical protein Drorol1_Dr00008155 [Drosera rotundifolia]
MTGDGRSTLFWTDPWVMDLPLRDYALKNVNVEDLGRQVEYYCDSLLGWCWDLLSDLLSEDILDRIASVRVWKEHGILDCMTCRCSIDVMPALGPNKVRACLGGWRRTWDTTRGGAEGPLMLESKVKRFYVTVDAVAVCGLADALVQGGLIGAAGELPERYMQAVVAGTTVSGVLSFLRIITKAAFSQDATGLRKSAILYFMVGTALMVVCVVFYNLAHRLPLIKYYNELKAQAVIKEKQEKDPNSMTGAQFRSTLWKVVGHVKWFGFGIAPIYVVTLSIFPRYITEDVHSAILKDWYAILLITGYNVFDLVGKFLTAVYLLENEKVAIGASVARLLFYPLFLGCLHGPKFFRTEIPVTILTCLLGLTNGYFTSVLMILAPKTV